MSVVIHVAGIAVVLVVSILLGFVLSGLWKISRLRIGSPLLAAVVLLGFTSSTPSWLMLLLLAAVILSVWTMARAIHRRWALNRIAYAEEQLDTAWGCLYAIYLLYVWGQRSFPYAWIERHWQIKLNAAVVTSVDAALLFLLFVASLSAMKRPYRRLKKWRATGALARRDQLVKVIAAGGAGQEKLKAYAESLIDRMIERGKIVQTEREGQRFVIDATAAPVELPRPEPQQPSPPDAEPSRPERERMMALHRQSFAAHPAAMARRDVRYAYVTVLFRILRDVVRTDRQAQVLDSLLRQYDARLELESAADDPIWRRDEAGGEGQGGPSFKAVKKLRWRRGGAFLLRPTTLKYAAYVEIVYTYAVLNGCRMPEDHAADLGRKLGIHERKRHIADGFCLALARGQEKEAQELLSDPAGRRLSGSLAFVAARHRASEAFERKRRIRTAVVATMSAGKSTFINALLGDNLLPSRQQACTAKITTFAGTDAADGYPIGRAELQDGGSVYSGVVGPDTLTEWNDRETAATVYIEGRFAGIAAERTVPVLIDTPGTNYSQDRSHYEATCRLLDEADYEALVYLVNATQIGSSDDRVLLSKVSESLRQLEPKRPIIVLLNKLDEFDLESDDDIERSVRGVERELAELGFQRPDIIPVSAYAAKLIRMALQEMELTRKEQKDLASFYRLFATDGVDFSAFARLSRPVPASPQDEAAVPGAVAVGDKPYDTGQLHKALHRTGIRLAESRLSQLGDE